MYEEVVLTDIDKIYERKFKIKILVKFKKNSMCSIETKPLCGVSDIRLISLLFKNLFQTCTAMWQTPSYVSVKSVASRNVWKLEWIRSGFSVTKRRKSDSENTSKTKKRL